MVHNQIDDFVNIVSEFRIIGHDIEQGFLLPGGVIGGFNHCRFFPAIQRREFEELSGQPNSLFIAVGHKVALTAFLHMKFS